MQPIAHFDLQHNKLWLSPVYNTSGEPVLAICATPGAFGSLGQFRLVESIFVISGFVLIVLASIVVYQEMTKTRVEQDFLNMHGVAVKEQDGKTPVPV